ncbi:hypothetical protein CV770_13280 [Bradyrhizobium sp. AC87j1]|nr:hypothetical protein CV770_13280 [Bradyrhizobium sp. AC87j1]
MTATILVVDDEPDLESLVLQKFCKQIREGSVLFVFAHDGLEALASIEEHPDVDLVVSDINMPRMDGLALLAKLQEADDRKSTIIVSAYGDMSNTSRGQFGSSEDRLFDSQLQIAAGQGLRPDLRVPRNTSKEFRRRADLLNFGIKLHTLRGIHATAPLDAGWTPDMVARRLGDDPAVVMRNYVKRKRSTEAQEKMKSTLTALAAGFLKP